MNEAKSHAMQHSFPQGRRRTFAGRVARWVVDRLGEQCLMDRQERALRLLEEALELAQAEGISVSTAERTKDRVYARPPGEPAQEFGGVMVCAYGWAVAAGEDPDVLTEREIARIEAVPAEVTRAKHAAKAASGTAREGKAP
jgi:hypothetical protein